MKIVERSPNLPEALKLMEELSEALEAITGDSGRSSFNVKDVCAKRGIFVIAYNKEGQAIGCGALRPIEDNITEVKRMYARTKDTGVGTKILSYLETRAKEFGYSALRLETRLINKRAVSFYEARGYQRIQNYGRYIDKPEAVCFEKLII